jgi:hypothetical protein
MFVRFRERRNDGREPQSAVQATLACTGRCRNRKGQRVGWGRIGTGCPERPHCRWRFDAGNGDQIAPYRLLVSLIKNRRVDGKVQQEHVADLGAIDGHMLSEFFGRIAPEQINVITDGKLEDWSRFSIERRRHFWDELEARLARLSNRLGADETAKVREAIHARIPKPTRGELGLVESFEWKRIRDEWARRKEGARKEIADYEEEIAKARAEIAVVEPVISDIDENMRKVQLRLAQGDDSVIEESVAVRNAMSR